MKVIVIFDVPVGYDWLRDRLREKLKDFGGTFLQRSVYEIDCDWKTFGKLYRVVDSVLRKGAGRVDFIFPCAKCYRNIRIIGGELD